MKIQYKIPLTLVLFSAITGLAIGFLGYSTGVRYLTANAVKNLTALADARKIELQSYFNAIQQDLILTAKNPNTIEAVNSFAKEWKGLKTGHSKTLKEIYINNNPYPKGQKQNLVGGKEDINYNKRHAYYHPWFQSLQKSRGYYDIFLFDTEGNLLYSVMKEDDFATNFLNEKAPYYKTGLGEVYRKALKSRNAHADFSLYTPSNDTPASFMAFPVFEGNKKIGVLSFQMPVNEINKIMDISSGLGKTGEIILLGADQLMRNNSRFTQKNDMLRTRLSLNTYRDEQLRSRPLQTDYRKNAIIYSALPFKLFQADWTIVALQEWNELDAILQELRFTMISMGAALLIIIVVIGYFIAGTITSPIIRFSEAMSRFSRGETELNSQDLQRSDEIGIMTRSLQFFFREAKEHLRVKKESELIRENAPDGILSIDQNGNIISVNNAIVRIFGYSAEELQGQHINILVPSSQHARHLHDISDYIAKGATKRMASGKDLVGMRKDGTIVPLTVGLSITQLEDGMPRIIATVQDITDRKQAEEQYNELSERMALILENAGEGIYGLDLNGHTTFCNRAAEEMLGYSLEEMLNRSQHELIHHHHADGSEYPKHECNIYKALKDGKIHTEDSEVFWKKDGLPLPVQYVSRPIIDRNNTITGAVVIFHDITERKKTEEQLYRQSHELQFKTLEAETEKNNAIQATKTKSQFLANMSHEIRTPMNGIIGMTELLLNNETDEQQRERLEIVKNCGDGLLDIINDILDLSKIDAGKLNLENIQFNLHDTISDIINILKSKADDKGIELALRYAPGTPLEVCGDPVRVRQIALNLIGNAIKFTKKGHVFLDVEASEQTEGKASILFQVKDTGTGIPKTKQSSIFDDFSQASDSTTREFGGTGLGLAITRKLVALMKGEIGLMSEEGKGSNFWFELSFPINEASQKEAPQNLKLENSNILIIDEQELSSTILTEYLEHSGMNVIVSKEPQQAVSNGEVFDIIAVSLPLSGMNVQTIAETIKANKSMKDTPLLLISSFDTNESLEEIKEMGYRGYLCRPFHYELLLKTIAAILEQETQEETKLITRLSIMEPRTGEKKPDYKISRINAHILVVEDNMTNQMVIEQMLDTFGCSVDIAGNGADALEMVEESNYDVILMDCRMPVMNGFEATAELRNNPERYNPPPIIALTANALAEDRQECLEAGMDDYLSKPVSEERLHSILVKWVGGTQEKSDYVYKAK